MAIQSTTVQPETIDGITFSFLNESDFRSLYNDFFKVNQNIFSSKTNTPFILDCGANIGMSVLTLLDKPLQEAYS